MSCDPWTEDHVMSCDPVHVVATGRYVVWPAGQGVVCHESSDMCVSKGKRDHIPQNITCLYTD